MTKDELLAELADVPGDMEICVRDQEWDSTYSVTSVRVEKAKFKEAFNSRNQNYQMKFFECHNDRFKKKIVVLE
jgi:hypothetical protein